MNKLLLKLILLPSGLWRSMGADLEQLKAILTLRITIDDRRPLTLRQRQNTKKEMKNGSLISAFIFTMMGIFYAFPIMMITNDIVFATSLYFSLLFLFMTLTLITDFSNTLFDNKDKYVLFPRPINDRTLVLSKLLHVLIYLLRMVIPLSLPAMVIMTLSYGWVPALFLPLPIVLMTCMALFIVNGFYIIVLQLARPERFKDVINYFQILTSIVFFASVYLLPQLFKEGMVENGFNFSRYAWMRYLPSSWLGSCFTWLGYKQAIGSGALNSTLGVLTPIVSAYILVRYLAPSFTKKIAGIDGSDSVPATDASGKVRSGSKLYQRLANLFNLSDEAKAGFIITWLQSSRSRTFRMRVYPSFAFVPIYFIYLLVQNGESLSYAFQHLGETKRYFLLLYMSSYVLAISLNYLVMSDQYKAAWVYYSSPVSVPGKVMIGALKALWVKFFLPFFIVLTAFSLSIWGIGILSDVLLTMVNVTVMALILARLSHRQLPFSMMEQQKQRGGKFAKGLLTMIIPVALGTGHYFSRELWWLKLVFLILSCALLWMIWESYSGTSWDNIAREEAER